jgi:DNA replication protein DnaC
LKGNSSPHPGHRSHRECFLAVPALDQQTSNLFYQVISTRHGHKRSTIITTNTASSDWGDILYDTTIAAAFLASSTVRSTHGQLQDN